MASEMSPEELLVLDEWLGDVKGMALALMTASQAAGGRSTPDQASYFVTQARLLIEAVNKEIAGIAEATLAKRDRRIDSLDSEADSESPG